MLSTKKWPNFFKYLKKSMLFSCANNPLFSLLLRSYKTTILQVKIINSSRHSLPEYKTEESAGMDIHALLDEVVMMQPMQRILIPTGLFIALPMGTEAQIRPRSGMALKQGITVLNSPGTIDSDYRGEIKILLINLSNENQTIQDGDRIAQIVFAKHEKTNWEVVTALQDTNRGKGGYGSTGVNNL